MTQKNLGGPLFDLQELFESKDTTTSMNITRILHYVNLCPLLNITFIECME